MMKTTATVLLIILGLPGTLSCAQAAEVDAADEEETACAGMSDGDFMGVEICNECHEDTVTAMARHWMTARSATVPAACTWRKWASVSSV